MRAAAGAADRSEPIVDMLYLRSLGMVELAAKQHADADAHLARALTLIEEVGFREPAIWRVEGDAVEAALAVGDLDRSEQLVRRFEQQAARSKIPWSIAVSARCRGLVIAAGGDLSAAALALEGALVAHEACPMPFERARTLHALGRVRRRLKQKRQARDAFEAALLLFDELGAGLWSERTREELGRVTTRKAPECADGDGAPDRGTRSRRADQPGDRRAGLRLTEDRGGKPGACLPQARHPDAGSAFAGARRADGSIHSVGYSRLSGTWPSA